MLLHQSECHFEGEDPGNSIVQSNSRQCLVFDAKLSCVNVVDVVEEVGLVGNHGHVDACIEHTGGGLVGVVLGSETRWQFLFLDPGQLVLVADDEPIEVEFLPESVE